MKIIIRTEICKELSFYSSFQHQYRIRLAIKVDNECNNFFSFYYYEAKMTREGFAQLLTHFSANDHDMPAMRHLFKISGGEIKRNDVNLYLFQGY